MSARESFKLDKWTVDPDSNTVTRGSESTRLEPRVMDLLVFFAKHPGEVLSRDVILGQVWPHAYVTDSVLQSAVSTLRKAFGDSPRQSRFLETIPKRGYRLLASSTARRPVLAVLPFENLTAEGDQVWLAEGVAGGLSDALGQHPELKILSRSSVTALHDQGHLPAALANTLGADYVVEGSVARTESRLALRVRLVDAADNSQLWSQGASVGLNDLFDAQDRLARAIARHLASKAGPSAATETHREIPTETVEDYLRGRYHWSRLDLARLPRALDCFQSAVQRSPEFAPAYAGMADVWGAFGYWGRIPAVDAGAKVRAAVRGRPRRPRAGRYLLPMPEKISFRAPKGSFGCLSKYRRPLISC